MDKAQRHRRYFLETIKKHLFLAMGTEIDDTRNGTARFVRFYLVFKREPGTAKNRLQDC